MNARVPETIARANAAGAYEQVAPATNEVAARLAQRLAAETTGEVLFGPGDRGRYATDASIYQAMPVVVFVPRSRTRRSRWTSAATCGCRSCRAGAAPASAARPSAPGW
ncbi:MAG: Fe-S protein, homolog of lactate dehydrogenase SO1521 [uncultured Ramlibacter sp.]|uniref:Fe-S protein, homolog of lactate dehydrogenase SO1521 n=1 Tax=uncultured Ramlibacter sp. TaxID=260755 RepID=A0A6J4NEC0_9BURK|nr:MAG: Fe-S protein, homolog of lactate dehydrogenase SO1521 [uncultured Ramlibacter sp.]